MPSPRKKCVIALTAIHPRFFGHSIALDNEVYLLVGIVFKTMVSIGKLRKVRCLSNCIFTEEVQQTIWAMPKNLRFSLMKTCPSATFISNQDLQANTCGLYSFFTNGFACLGIFHFV